MKTGKLIIVFAAAFLMFFIGAVVAAVQPPEGDITMQVAEGAKATKPNVVFNHKYHSGFECAKCHHMWDGQAAVQACKTSGCHSEYENRGAKQSYYRAFHAPADPGMTHESCMNCHRGLEKEGKEAGPTTCAKGKSCHIFE